MRIAWYLANLLFELISDSGSFFHIVSMSKNVEEARKVSAVFLRGVNISAMTKQDMSPTV